MKKKKKSCYLEPMPKQNHNHLWFKPNEILSLVKRRQQSEFPNPTQFEDTCIAVGKIPWTIAVMEEVTDRFLSRFQSFFTIVKKLPKEIGSQNLNPTVENLECASLKYALL